MGQMVLIDEDELNKLKFDSFWFNQYYLFLNKCDEELYPHIKYWADTGSGAEINLKILSQMKKDLKNSKKNIFTIKKG